jgi:hypothetical protein
MFGKRKRSKIRCTTIEENYTSHKNSNADAKTDMPERCFFRILNYLDFPRFAWTFDYLRLVGRAIVFNFPIWETTCYFPTRVSKITISFMYFEKKTILRLENKAFPKGGGRSVDSKPSRLQGLYAGYPRTEHGSGKVLGGRVRFLVEESALFTRFPRFPLRHQYDEQ